MTDDSPQLNGMSSDASKEFRRVYDKLDALGREHNAQWNTVTDQLAAMRTDRKWYFGAVTSVAGAIVGTMLLLNAWQNRLIEVESAQRAHLESGVVIHSEFRKDINRNAIDIAELKQKSWRPARGEKEE